MSISFTHLLHRATRLRQRFDAERRAAASTPLRLLKLRSVLFKAEQRLRELSAARVPLKGQRRLQPAMAMAMPIRISR